jgi:hypothetical protein
MERFRWAYIVALTEQAKPHGQEINLSISNAEKRAAELREELPVEGV